MGQLGCGQDPTALPSVAAPCRVVSRDSTAGVSGWRAVAAGHSAVCGLSHGNKSSLYCWCDGRLNCLVCLRSGRPFSRLVVAGATLHPGQFQRILAIPLFARGLLGGTVHTEATLVPLGLNTSNSYTSSLWEVSMGVEEACVLVFNSSGEVHMWPFCARDQQKPAHGLGRLQAMLLQVVGYIVTQHNNAWCVAAACFNLSSWPPKLEPVPGGLKWRHVSLGSNHKVRRCCARSQHNASDGNAFDRPPLPVHVLSDDQRHVAGRFHPPRSAGFQPKPTPASPAVSLCCILDYIMTERGPHLSASCIARPSTCSCRAVFCWGGNQHGQCGTGYTSSLVAEPTAVTGFDGIDIVHVEAGDRFTCARSSVGDVYCWGGFEGTQGGLRSISLDAIKRCNGYGKLQVTMVIARVYGCMTCRGCPAFICASTLTMCRHAR